MGSMRLVCVLDCHDPARLAQFWAEAIGYRQASSAEPYLILVPRHGDGPELVLQRVPDAKCYEPRIARAPTEGTVRFRGRRPGPPPLTLAPETRSDRTRAGAGEMSW